MSRRTRHKELPSAPRGDAVLTRVGEVFDGSDGNATKDLYALLCQKGPIGTVAMNLFRASKCSARAKVYRGGDENGSWREQAYARKKYSIEQLCKILATHAAALSIDWWWGRDEVLGGPHSKVLYVDVPVIGQISFHSDERESGPDYKKGWDGVRGAQVGRVCLFAADVLRKEAA